MNHTYRYPAKYGFGERELTRVAIRRAITDRENDPIDGSAIGIGDQCDWCV